MQVNKAAEEPDFAGVDVMYLPLSLESALIEGKYALLAAVHDECVASSDADELIHPWASEADFGGPDKVVNIDPEVLDAVATYVPLMANILPDQVDRGIERSKSYRLLGVLRAVANDVKSAAKVWVPDRSICADESGPDPVQEYESFLRRTDAETSNGGSTTQVKQDATPDDDGTKDCAGFLSSELRSMIDIGQTALNHYAKEAGVPTPKRGKKNHRYSVADARKIVEAVRDGTSDADVVQQCRGLLKGRLSEASGDS